MRGVGRAAFSRGITPSFLPSCRCRAPACRESASRDRFLSRVAASFSSSSPRPGPQRPELEGLSSGPPSIKGRSWQRGPPSARTSHSYPSFADDFFFSSLHTSKGKIQGARSEVIQEWLQFGQVDLVLHPSGMLFKLTILIMLTY